MKNAHFTVMLTAAVIFLAISAAEAQMGMGKGMKMKGGGGWGQDGQYGRMYDPASVETVKGNVVSVENFTPMRGMSQGVHVTLKTEKESVPVHLGPSWYLENQDIAIETGDTLEVKGSRITYDGKPAIIAASVTKGDSTLNLRDAATGFPAWAGWRRMR